MSAALLLASLLPLLPPPSAGAVSYVESFVAVRVAGDDESRLLGVDCDDADGDGRGDLLLRVARGHERALHLHRCGADLSFAALPDWRMSIPADVLAFGLAELRPEPGREVLLLTAGGLFSVSTAQAQLRDNLRREVAVEVFPELAERDQLPRWWGVLDLDGDGRDEVLLPQKGRLAIAAADGEGLRVTSELRLRDERPSRQRGRGLFRRGGSDGDPLLRALFPRSRSTLPSFRSLPYLARDQSYAAPAFVDWDGDGRRDAVWRVPGALEVSLQDDGGGFGEARRAGRMLPAADDDSGEDRNEDVDLDPSLVDVDGDGRLEVLAIEERGDGLDKEFVAKLLGRGADGVLLDEPLARLKFQATAATFDVVDVDGDGLLDLVATTFDVPTGVTSLAAVRVDVALLAFRGTAGPGFSRRPDLRHERRLRPEQLERIRESFISHFAGDYDGDGVRDLLTMRSDGLLQIFAVRSSGGALAVADAVLAEFLPSRPIRETRVVAAGPGRASDLMLIHEDAVTIFVARAAEGGR